jgi:hypothetical protein
MALQTGPPSENNLKTRSLNFYFQRYDVSRGVSVKFCLDGGS